MFSFAFEREVVEQAVEKLDETALLSSLFMTILENQRLDSKCSQLTVKVAELQSHLAKTERSNELTVLEQERRCKELRGQAEALRSELASKQQECFSLKAALDDCPKLEELNRWIAKVKEYEERQMTACSKMSHLSGELCGAREKLRRLEGEHRDLQRVRQELEAALTESKGNEDSMLIYFQRLETYERVIKELEDEIRRVEQQRAAVERTHQAKLEAADREKETAVAQWQALAEEMGNQKTILAALQQEVEKYQAYIAEQNQRQSELARNQQLEMARHQQLEMERLKAQEREREERRKREETRLEPYSFIDHSKVSERSNRSLSLQNKKTEERAETEHDSSYTMQSHLVCDPPSRAQRASSAIGRATSQQRIIYHSDPHSRNSTSRLNTQTSTGCGECISRVQDRHELSNRSLQLQEARSHELRGEMSQIADEKKLLMEKLNILKPQDPNVRLERNISSLYSKNYRQVTPSSQTVLKLNPSAPKAHLAPSPALAPSHRLQLGREKENLNDMIVRRYANLQRH